LAHKIVLDLEANVEKKGFVISMDNFFTFVGLFKKLASRQIYGIGIVRTKTDWVASSIEKYKHF
jgi:hypothetical protein